MRVYSPLYTITSMSGATLDQRKVPEQYIFTPSVIPPTIEVSSPKVDESVVADFKSSMRDYDYAGATKILTTLYTDKSLLVRAILESAIEYINDAAPSIVDTIITTTHGGMDAKTLMAVMSLFMRAPRSAGYSEYVKEATEGYDPAYEDAYMAASGLADPEGAYEKLSVCEYHYWAYPYFVRDKMLDVNNPVITLPGLTGGARKKARELEALN